MSRPLRIGLLTPGWPGQNTANGIATSVYHLAMGLKAIGQTPVVFGDADGPVPDDIPFVPLPKVWSLANRIRVRFNAPAASRSARIAGIIEAIRIARRDHGIDLVLMEETRGWCNDVIRAVDLPVVIVLHGPWMIHKHFQIEGAWEARKREERERAAFQIADGLLSPSANVLEAVEAGCILPDIPRQVIYNSFAPDGPVPADRPPDGPILFIGRFDGHKGGDVVLQAFDRLHAARPDARLTFVGPDKGLKQPDGSFKPMQAALDEMAPAARAAVEVLGQQPHDRIAELRKTHPIALIASRYENLNYTLLEAMAAGQAIVSTKVGGPAEILNEGSSALLVPPEDPAAMANALQRLIAEPDLAKRLGDGARMALDTSFHPEIIARQTVEFCLRLPALSAT